MKKFAMIGAGLALIVVAGASIAMPAFKSLVATQYKVKPGGTIDKAGCTLCHVSMAKLKEFNPFGTDLKAALTAAKTKALTPAILKQVENLDSDKDGVKNGAELAADKLPGDKNSK